MSEDGLMESLQNGLFNIQHELTGGGQREDFVERQQFIGMMIGPEEFLLPIATVKEILMLRPITFVPGSPKYIDGVLNLRGTILPAINVRKMFGLERAAPAPTSRIIIAKHQQIQCGLLVDNITYVLSLLPDQIEMQPLTSKGSGAAYLCGVSRRTDVVNGILDLGKILETAADGRTLEESEEEGGEAAA